MTFEYKINRIQKTKTRVFWYPTYKGKRFTSTNFAKKYDAKGLVTKLVRDYGAESLIEKFNKAHG